MKNHLALLALFDVQEPLVKEAMLKEAAQMPLLAKLLSKATGSIKNAPGVQQVRNSVVPKIKYDRRQRARSNDTMNSIVKLIGKFLGG